MLTDEQEHVAPTTAAKLEDEASPTPIVSSPISSTSSPEAPNASRQRETPASLRAQIARTAQATTR